MNPPLSTPNPAKQNFSSVPSARLMGFRIDLMEAEKISATADAFFHSEKSNHIITANSLMILEARKSALLREAMENAGLITVESSGLAWALRFLTRKSIGRIPGIDLSLRLCRIAEKRGVRVFLVGGKPDVAKRAAAHLKVLFPQLFIAGFRDGFFNEGEEKAIAESIVLSKAGLVLVALGMPRQEEWIHRNISRLPPGIAVGIGGSFDVWAGDVNRAPEWMQKRGLEWLYRVFKEPFRWKRIVKLPLFVILVIRERFFQAAAVYAKIPGPK